MKNLTFSSKRYNSFNFSFLFFKVDQYQRKLSNIKKLLFFCNQMTVIGATPSANRSHIVEEVDKIPQ